MSFPARLHPDDLAALQSALSQPIETFGGGKVTEETVRRIAYETAEIVGEKLMERLLERLGIEPTTEGFKEFSRNMDWISNRRGIESKIKLEGIKKVLFMGLGLVGAAIAYWVKSGFPTSK